MRKLLALLAVAAVLLTPFGGVAQTLAPMQPLSPVSSATAQPLLLEQLLGRSPLLDGADSSSVPLWSTPDGRILAVVAANDGDVGYPTLPKSPQLGMATEWHLVDVTNMISGGLLMRLGDNAAAHVSLGQTTVRAPVYAPNLFCSPADSNASCGSGSNIIARGGELRLGTNITASENFDLDLSYDLSWLRRTETAPNAQSNAGYDSLLGMGNSSLPTLVIPGLDLANVQNSSINALGRLHLNDSQVLDLGASLGRIQLSIPGAAPLTSLNQAAVSFGVEYGAFSGILTGRMLGPVDSIGANSNGTHWSGLDVGISWRTPWRSMFSIGTKNLLSSGNLPLLNPPAAHEIDPNQARVPYVHLDVICPSVDAPRSL
jgi:hypothetical protein